MSKRRRACLAACLITIGAMTAFEAPAASAKALCVGSGQSCYATIQAAVDAAKAGDRIELRPGTHGGGGRSTGACSWSEPAQTGR